MERDSDSDSDSDSGLCPYEAGEVIELNLLTPGQPQQQLKATILHLFEPFTLSCAMVVRIDNQTELSSEGHMVLKLFDRRFLPDFRKPGGVDSWTPKIEKEFQRLLNDGRSSQFLAKLQADVHAMSPHCQMFSAAQREAYMTECMKELYNTEVRAYDTLRDLQGDVIPRLIGHVTIHGSLSSKPDSPHPYTAIPGILLQYVRGFALKDLGMHAPRETWKGLCEDAMRILQVIGERGVLNQDVQTRSFIVRKLAVNHYKLFMIDFGICKFRADSKNEEQWRKWRAEEDEEGDIGRGMESELEGGYVYCQSSYSKKLMSDG